MYLSTTSQLDLESEDNNGNSTFPEGLVYADMVANIVY